MEWTHGLFTSLDITIHKDDNFTLNCGPTIPVGCEEQIANAGPFLSCEGAGTQTDYLSQTCHINSQLNANNAILDLGLPILTKTIKSTVPNLRGLPYTEAKLNG